jgi:hypothetical protein
MLMCLCSLPDQLLRTNRRLNNRLPIKINFVGHHLHILNSSNLATKGLRTNFQARLDFPVLVVLMDSQELLELRQAMAKASVLRLLVTVWVMVLHQATASLHSHLQAPSTSTNRCQLALLDNK